MRESGGQKKKHFPQYKVLLLFMWSVEIYSLKVCAVYSHGDPAGVNSIFGPVEESGVSLR